MLGDYLTYWLGGVAIHRLRENTHTRYAACVRLHLVPGLGTKKIARLTAKDVRTFLDRLRTTCQCCTQGLDTERKRCCTVGECCQKQLSALTVTYVHSVLKSAPRTRRPRRRTVETSPATSRPSRTSPGASGRSPQPRLASSSTPPAPTGSTPCTNSHYEPASAKASSSASTGKTSTSPPEQPASATRSSAPGPAASPTSPPRPERPNVASHSRPNASTLSRSTSSSMARSARPQGQPGRTAASSSPHRLAGPSTPPTSPAASAASSNGPDSDASASTTYATRPPPCSWSKASISS